MNRAYPMVLSKAGNQLSAHVPDFGLTLKGTDYAELISLARESIGQKGIELQDKQLQLPLPSSFEKLQKETPGRPDRLITLIDVDFNYYRQKYERRTVRRNVSLPAWLDQAATEAKINVSALLQRALKQELDL